jgi:hypothetical protein
MYGAKYLNAPLGIESPEYTIWSSIKTKCKTQKFSSKGIIFYPPWAEDFTLFLKDLGVRPGPKYTLRRLDKKSSFMPGNLKWYPPVNPCFMPQQDQRAPKPPKTEQLIGKKFNKLLVIELVPYFSKAQNKYLYWAKVKCNCGNIFEITRRSLGRRQACDECELLRKEKQFYWGKVLSGARDRNIEISINVEYAWELLKRQEYRCALTGKKITFGTPGVKSRWGGRTASLDRIDSSLGYIEGNVQWVHKDINLMKMELTESNFIAWCHAVAAHRPLVLST